MLLRIVCGNCWSPICRDEREQLLDQLIDEPDYEWLIIDASHSKVHPHAAGARGGSQAMGRTKRGLDTQIHLAVDAHGMPLGVLVTLVTEADCTHAESLIEGLSAEHLLADKGYDSDAVVEQVRPQGMQAQIPPRKNRKKPRAYDPPLHTAAFGRKCFFGSQTLARHCHSLGQKLGSVSRRRSDPLPRTLGKYLVTTLSRAI